LQGLLDGLNQSFREGLTGVKVIRAFSKENQEYEKYHSVNREYTKAYITAGTIMSVAIPIVTMLVSLATVVIVWLGGAGVQSGGMEVGAIMGAVSYSAQILMGFGMLTNILFEIPRGQVSAKRINEVLDMPISISDPLRSGGIHDGSLVFENVDFRYEGANRKTLTDISFSMAPSQTLAIIGSTGGGKTSLVQLIPRLYDVEKGSVKVGGTNVKDLDQRTLQELVRLVPQKSTLFFGTIRSNMLMAKPDATDEEIWAALDMAHATEFVALEDKELDSEVEKGGGNFSGGQKQRLCIARALLKDAAIYVFDDSFSALDFKTDAQIRRDMRGKLAKAVTVIVAQRIGTIMDADLIAVLDDGRIAGLGTHEELKANCPVYRQIIDSQFREEVLV
jgi:ATP-binding cassette subfamily B protein